MITFSQLVDKVFVCRSCPESYGFTSRAPGKPYFKFPPIIGKTHNAEILFVGINPRISNTNRSLHDALMLDKSNYLDLSANKDCGQSYIEQEGHYRFHVRLVKKLFGELCVFENVAAVTEIFFCATEDTRNLPNPESPCGNLYLGDTVRLTNPQVIVAVGKRVVDYFTILPHIRRNRNYSVLKLDGRDIPVVEMFHPAERELTESQKNVRLLEAVAQIRQIRATPVL